MSTLLCIHPSDELYGSDRVLLDLLTNLDGYTPIVVLPCDLAYEGKLSKQLLDHNIKVLHHDFAVLRRQNFSVIGFFVYCWRFLLSLPFLIRLIRREKPTVILTNTIVVLPLAVAAFLTRTRHIWYVHEIVTASSVVRILTAWLAVLLSWRVVCPSDAVRQHLLASTSTKFSERITVIYNGIDDEPFLQVTSEHIKQVRTKWGVNDSRQVVGMVGRLGIWKGQEDFIDAARHIVTKFPAVQFVIAGGALPGQTQIYSDLQRRIDENNLAEKVILVGYRSDIPTVMQAFDIFVLPSRQPDPFPLVVLEAMAARRPIVAYAHGGCLESVLPEETGLLVEPNNSRALADALLLLLTDNERRLRYGNAGRERYIYHYRQETFVQRWRNLLHDTND